MPSAEQVAIVAGTTPSKQRASASRVDHGRAPSASQRCPALGPWRLHEHLAHVHAQRDARPPEPAVATPSAARRPCPSPDQLVAIAREARAVGVVGAALAQPEPLICSRAVVGRGSTSVTAIWPLSRRFARVAPDSTAGTKTVTSLGWLDPASWSAEPERAHGHERASPGRDVNDRRPFEQLEELGRKCGQRPCGKRRASAKAANVQLNGADSPRLANS